MSDLLWFSGIVAVVVVVGIRVGMIVAGRMDLFLAARADAPDDTLAHGPSPDGAETEEDRPT